MVVTLGGLMVLLTKGSVKTKEWNLLKEEFDALVRNGFPPPGKPAGFMAGAAAPSPRLTRTTQRPKAPAIAPGFLFGDHQLFTPVFTPARFFAPNGTRNFQQVTAPQAQTQFAAECCPLYPERQKPQPCS